MNSRESELKAIFCEALEHAVGPARSAYVDGAGRGDATLRLQVESLLRAHEMTGGFMATPVPSANATRDRTLDPDCDSATSVHQPPIFEGPGSSIGPYKLLQQIGEGGMGSVFMA